MTRIDHDLARLKSLINGRNENHVSRELRFRMTPVTRLVKCRIVVAGYIESANDDGTADVRLDNGHLICNVNLNDIAPE